MAYRQDDDKDERNDDAQDNQLDLHVLQPHLSPHLGALLPEILCLQTVCLGSSKKQLQVCSLLELHETHNVPLVADFDLLGTSL